LFTDCLNKIKQLKSTSIDKLLQIAENLVQQYKYFIHKQLTDRGIQSAIKTSTQIYKKYGTIRNVEKKIK